MSTFNPDIPSSLGRKSREPIPSPLAIQPSPSEAEKEPRQPLVTPGHAEEIAEEIAEVSPEGRPGDPKSGPGLIRIEMAFLYVLVIGFAIGVGVFFGWAAGLVVLVLGVLGLVVNPVMGAAAARAHDREPVAARHAGELAPPVAPQNGAAAAEPVRPTTNDPTA